jgi:hypothetical protein
MSNEIDRGRERADAARRNDDSDIIDKMEDAPSFNGSAGGNLQRDIATGDEMKQEIGDGDSITRVRDSDKRDQADLPRFYQK